MEQSAFHTALLDSVPGDWALFLREGSREIVAANAAAQQLGAVPGKTCYETCVGRETPCPFCLAPRLWATGERQEIEVEYGGKWYAGVWAPLPEHLYIHYLLDITERKQLEEQLTVSERQLSSIYRTVDDAIFELAVEPDGQYRFVSINPAFCRITGLSTEMVVGRCVAEVIPEPSLSAVLEKYQRAVEGRGMVRWEEASDFPTGRLVGDVTVSPVLDSEGRCTHLVGSVHDMTDRRQAESMLREREEQLRHAQKMEAIGQLAGGIAHDFNNLLTAIIGYSELALANNDIRTLSARGDIEQIRSAADRASLLTKQILAFSRRQALRPQLASLNTVLVGMEPLLRRTIGEDIDLLTALSPDLGLAEIDVHQFEQVLLNLAVNARDAMPLGGRLTIETGNVELDGEYCRSHPDSSPGQYVMLSVSDTGVGMDEGTKSRIFEPFFTTKPSGLGTGLGLSTVYGIVKQSGGGINVCSEPGDGTAFKVYLPRVGSSAATEAGSLSGNQASPSASVGHETVLLVEDEPALRTLAERVLGGAGYQVLSAGDAAEALELLAQGGVPDVLLTDVLLPGGMQGNDLARQLLATRPDLPVLYMSGYARDTIVHAGRLDDGVNYIEKPFTPEALTAMLRHVIDRAGRAS